MFLLPNRESKSQQLLIYHKLQIMTQPNLQMFDISSSSCCTFILYLLFFLSINSGILLDSNLLFANDKLELLQHEFTWRDKDFCWKWLQLNYCVRFTATLFPWTTLRNSRWQINEWTTQTLHPNRATYMPVMLQEWVIGPLNDTASLL